MRSGGGVSRRRRIPLNFLHGFLLISTIICGFGLLILTIRSISIDPNAGFKLPTITNTTDDNDYDSVSTFDSNTTDFKSDSCATVEEMGEVFAPNEFAIKESLRVRRMIQQHFLLNGAPRVRDLSPEQFCRHGFVLGKSAEAGFGNEMYKILSAAALSIMLNRSLIIGQTRGKYPFGEYISYTNLSFTLKEVKHLWRQNDCMGKYGRPLIMRTDDFEKPGESNVLCSNWRKWNQPVIWFQGTTDAVGIQLFLKNIHSQMRSAASELFGQAGALLSRPNVFGELMRVIVSPSEDVEQAVNWVLSGGVDPDIALHMRMLTNRSVRALQAALSCLKKALLTFQQQAARPRVVLVSDSPSLIKDITPSVQEFAEVVHFDYKLFNGNISSLTSNNAHQLDFRVKDWGPAPRWVAFVDFFLASRVKHGVVSGAHRRVGTTYAQLIAALAAANQLGEGTSPMNFTFLSSFQKNLLSDGLANQVGWGHVWNRFAGPLSCHGQSNQCAHTPLLPPAWWDGAWQSPISRDIRRMEAFGVQLSSLGEINESSLRSYCENRKSFVRTAPIVRQTL
ncbi:hypothetical protein AQUCO_01100058v1 [Aquilegia coerulea]|uniref:Transmembrane protein n=1 Tax=Aquilegia coerulea TaxID=218851 RepID=A0A2G5E612_AQUCA|nr:hypothetical protein AQUCO_01100058v1 [Aquilegia coerulea]